MQSSSLDRFVGQNIGIYRVERLLGRGLVNAVYLAYHSRENTPVALLTSILPATFSFEARQRFLVRFRKEAIRLTALRQAHILPIYDFGEYAGSPYLVTPYMANGSLADILKRRGRLHHANILDILQQVVAGLAYAHERGVFHGALKPANIVLNDQRQMLVAGFGLAHILQMSGIEPDRRPYGHLFDIAGMFLTPAEYIAPEVVQGQPADARTDIYSLGVILYELLSGRTPFTGTNPLDVAIQHIQKPVLPLRAHCPDVPLALAAVVNQALERDPERRFQRVDELAEAFAQVSAVWPEKGTGETIGIVAKTELPETPADGYAFGGWQLLPPIITEKIAAVEPTSRKTSDQEQVRPVPLTRPSSTFASRPEPVEAASSPQEAIYDLWILSPQDSSRRSDATQWNANPTAQHARSNQHSRPFEGRKTRGNERVTRRKAVALLATGGVAVAGIAVAIQLAANPSDQQTPNNAANLAKNAAMNFVNPSDGKASVLVHLTNGDFVAYDRACTHAGVYVRYDPVKQLLVCPAHGATFDPAQGGAVEQGPATQPLPRVVVHIKTDGTITA